MNILIINGCENDQNLELEVADIICRHLKEKNMEYIIDNLDEIKPTFCIGCNSCQDKNPGVCAINDGINQILKQYLSSDICIIITPIQFGCCNSLTKNFIDRTEPLFLPYQISKNGKTVMQKRYKKYPDLIFMGVTEIKDLDSEENFKETVLKCNLSEASKTIEAKIITHKEDLYNLKEIGLV